MDCEHKASHQGQVLLQQPGGVSLHRSGGRYPAFLALLDLRQLVHAEVALKQLPTNFHCSPGFTNIFLFIHGIILPFDELIFFRGVETTNQYEDL